jgi:ubiquinol-cytochrome c reductase iron-sulfur subunit
MPALTSKASSLVSQCARTPLRSTALRATTAGAQQRHLSEVSASSSFDSPFKGVGSRDTTKIPSFAAYKSSGGEQQNKLFQYFMVGTLGAITAMGAKATVQGASMESIRGM